MNKEQIEQDSYGKKIDLVKANKLIREFLILDDVIEKKVKQEADPEKKKKAEELKGRTYNAFIFHRDYIMRFFDGSEIDQLGKPQESQYLMVLLGAHEIAEDGFKAGSFTVITTGCNIGEETLPDGKKETVFYPLNTTEQKPANEYPPNKVVTELKLEAGTQQSIKYFRLIS